MALKAKVLSIYVSLVGAVDVVVVAVVAVAVAIAVVAVAVAVAVVVAVAVAIAAAVWPSSNFLLPREDVFNNRV